MIDDHLIRLYREVYGTFEPYVDVLYKNENGKLREKKIPYAFIYRSAIIRCLAGNIVFNTYLRRNQDDVFDFMKLHFYKAQELVKKQFPGSKIVIFYYEGNIKSTHINRTKRWNELRDEGFIVINSYELTHTILDADEYRAADHCHPNEKAWDLIVPKLAEALNL